MSNEGKPSIGSHRFHFSKDGLATCSCGGWTLAKVPMSAVKAQRLVKRYGKGRFGPDEDVIEKAGTQFRELTADEAIKDWGCHVKNLPEKGGRVHGCGYIKKQRTKQGELIAA